MARLSFYLIVSFLFLRPLSGTLGGLQIGDISIFEFVGIAFSYILIVSIIIGFGNIKIDSLNLLIIFFVFYCCASLVWGSTIGKTARTVLPFISFFAILASNPTPSQIRTYLIALSAGYFYPIVISFLLIISGQSVYDKVYFTELERFSGLFTGTHEFGHAMMFFSFLVALAFTIGIWKLKVVKLGVVVLLLFSMVNLYKSGVRTAILGFFLFWTVFLWRTRKILLITGIIAVLSVGLYDYTTMAKLVLNRTLGEARQATITTASSGRDTIWEHNLEIFEQFPLFNQIFGAGLGLEEFTDLSREFDLWPSHNDFLTLLMTTGVVGLGLYLSILGCLLLNFLTANISSFLKSFYVSMFFAVIVMNFFSNSYVTRFELSQLFWTFMAIFYRLRDMEIENSSLPPRGNVLPTSHARTP